MSLIDRLEKKLGWLAVPGLPIYIVTAQSILYLWGLINPESRLWLMLDPVAIQNGHEYWRLITFLFLIPTQNAFFAFFFLYLLYVYGTALEEEWGSFHFSLFYYIGAIGTSVAAFFFGGTDGAFYLNTTIFLAFAAVHPDFILYFFFVIPLKVKWLAMVSWVLFVISLWNQPVSGKIAILVSLANYLLFFSQRHVEWVLGRIRFYRNRGRYN